MHCKTYDKNVLQIKKGCITLKEKQNKKEGEWNRTQKKWCRGRKKILSGMIATITDYVSERVADGKDALVNF